jgi:hypothetical protein
LNAATAQHANAVPVTSQLPCHHSNEGQTRGKPGQIGLQSPNRALFSLRLKSIQQVDSTNWKPAKQLNACCSAKKW